MYTKVIFWFKWLFHTQIGTKFFVYDTHGVQFNTLNNSPKYSFKLSRQILHLKFIKKKTPIRKEAELDIVNPHFLSLRTKLFFLFFTFTLSYSYSNQFFIIINIFWSGNGSLHMYHYRRQWSAREWGGIENFFKEGEIQNHSHGTIFYFFCSILSWSAQTASIDADRLNGAFTWLISIILKFRETNLAVATVPHW